MTHRTFARAALVAGLLSAAGFAGAAEKTYQVTGPVAEVSDKSIVVEKGKEKWEIARTPDTKVTGDVKKGDKVTVEYTMTARTITAKPPSGKTAK